jgi:excisionase family DNA binding protein
MSEAQMLFPIEPKEFWQKLKAIVEQVVIEHTNFSGATGGSKIHQRPLLKAVEVCATLRISKPTLYQWMNSGKLPSIKIESRRYFKWEDVQKLVESSREGGQSSLRN